jgi:ribose transport system ATP-binding protein
LKGITKIFSKEFTLENINLNLYPGEVHIITGENGSGKTAVMKIICGIEKQDSGSVFINNREISLNSIYEAKKEGILYIMQDTNLYYNLSVAENIFFDKLSGFKNLLGINYAHLFFDCQRLFDELQIKIDIFSNVQKLGLAQKQLIELAKAYVSNAKIIIFDEPSSAFTDSETEILFFIINYLKSKGISIFYISHRLDEIVRIGDRISVLLQGRLVGTKTVAKEMKRDVIKMMTGLTFDQRYPKIKSNIGKAILEAKHLSSQNILKDINFFLRKGEILGIAGLAGSGRSYLANCLFGAINDYLGDIFIFGEKKNPKTPSDAFKSGIILLPEDRIECAVYENFDALFNLTVMSLRRFVDKSLINLEMLEDTGKGYIERFSIKPEGINHPLTHYSGGNQQKLILSRLIMTRSRIFILDEPTRGIDIASKVDIYNSMNDIISKGSSILFISSEAEELLGMCDRILVMSNGKIVADLLPGKTTKEQILYFATM